MALKNLPLSAFRLPLALGLTLGISADAALAFPTTFKTKATLALCGDYQFGGVTVEIKYRVNGEAAFHDVVPLSQSFNSADNTGTFTFELPSIYGKDPVAVAAFCRNTIGLSPASNELVINNCDAEAVKDTDQDGIFDSSEDTNCNGFFDPSDPSNLYNVDTDGDGVRDLVEKVNGEDPANPGSSPRPYIYASAPFDPNGDGTSNAVAWRPWNGTWYIKDLNGPEKHFAVQFGAAGDIPFVYQPTVSNTEIGVVRREGNNYRWLFHGPGLEKADGTFTNNILFGIFGDNIVLGPWETPGVTTPAVARLFNDIWSFDILLKDGSIRHVNWGTNGDTPKVQDYDGDGIFDVAVFRPSQQKSYVILSTNGAGEIYNFGTGTAEHTVKGDYTGDGVDDVSFWEPTTGLFTTLKSDKGFNTVQAAKKNTLYYQELQLGTYNVHLPLSWVRHDGKMVYTIVDHATGFRYYRPGNKQNEAPVPEQWGLKGDALG